MRKLLQIYLIIFLVLGVVALSLWGFCYTMSRADEARPGATASTQPVDAVGDSDAKAIRAMLGQLTNAALAKNGFNHLTQFLHLDAGGDAGAFKNFDDINDALDLFQKDWSHKYDGDFNINPDNEQLVYSEGYRFMRGENDQSAMLEVLPSEMMRGVTLRVASASQPATWRIVLGKGADETSIHDALLKQLNILHDQRHNWPADKNTAYRVITDRVLTAIAEANAG